MGWLLSETEKLIDSVIENLFPAITIRLPNFEFNIPILSNINNIVEKAKREMTKVIDYFRNLLDLDGINDLFEPVIKTITDAIPKDILGCDPFGSDDEDDCIGNLPNVALELEETVIDGLELPVMTFGNFEMKLPDELVSIVKSILDNILDLQDSVLGLFDVFECTRYDTFTLDVIDVIRDDYLHMTKEEFPFPSCPLNIQLCTDFHFPGLDKFQEEISKFLENIFPGSNGKRRLVGEGFCGKPNYLTGRPWEGQIKFPIPLGDLINLGVDKMMKFFKFIGKADKQIKLGQAYIRIIALKNMKFNLGFECKEGKLGIKLSLGSMFSFKIGSLTNFKPSKHAKNTLTYLSEEGDKKPDMTKWEKQVKEVDDIHKIVCGKE